MGFARPNPAACSEGGNAYRRSGVHRGRQSMHGDFGIGATEVIVFSIIASIVWGLRVLATATRTRPLNEKRGNQ
jgi:hypothetical protein